MEPHIKPLADWLHVARINVRTEVEPKVYEIGGQVDTTDRTFHDGAAETEVMVLSCPKLNNAADIAKVYSRGDPAIWRSSTIRKTEEAL